MKRELLVFAKNPVAGKVKTRLARDTGAEDALKIYLHLLDHTARVCRKIPVRVSVYLSESIKSDLPWPEDEFDYYLQSGSHLGERMENAFREAFERGSREVIIIGSDLYDLSAEILEEGFQKLQEHDAVIGPAKDGGYYLMGLKQIPTGVFSNKKWGGDTILKSTLENLKGYDVALLRELNDIDVMEDLKAYPELMKLIKH